MPATPPLPEPGTARRWRRLLLPLIPLLLGLAHWGGLIRLPLVGTLDHQIDDLRQRISLDDRPEQRIVIVAIDDPRPDGTPARGASRERLAQLADELFVRQRAAVVGFGMALPHPDAGEGLDLLNRLALTAADTRLAHQLRTLRPTLDHDAALARALHGRRAVLGFEWRDDAQPEPDTVVGRLPPPLPQPPQATLPELPSYRGAIGNLAALAEAAGRAGFVNLQPDDDGVVRSLPLLANRREAGGAPQLQPSFALAVLRAVHGDPPLQWPAPAHLLLPSAGGPLAFALDDGAAVRVPYRQARQFRILAAADVIARRLHEGELGGRIVLVGPMALSPNELKPTPLHGTTPGLLVQASLLAGLLDGRLPQQPAWAHGFEGVSLVAGCLLLAALLPRLRARRAGCRRAGAGRLAGTEHPAVPPGRLGAAGRSAAGRHRHHRRTRGLPGLPGRGPHAARAGAAVRCLRAAGAGAPHGQRSRPLHPRGHERGQPRADHPLLRHARLHPHRRTPGA